MKVYLDNAATTPIDPEVLKAMWPVFEQHYGNPSSTHAHGREVKVLIEKSRKKVADLLQVTPSEIFFTSGGTESDNTALRGAVRARQIKHVLSSPIEHHAVLHTLEDLHHTGAIQLDLLAVDQQGQFDRAELEKWLAAHPNALVSLMHGNNEIGNLIDLAEIAELCQSHGAFFHSDTVQTLGHYPLNLREIPLDSLAGSAHKFHGPKGIGILFLRKTAKLPSFMTGGGQERNMRGGTENVYGIVALAKALEIAIGGMDEHRHHVLSLKKRMIERLQAKVPGVAFNGRSAELDHSLYTVLNISLPPSPENEMLLFNLDLQHISASGGSACSSGAATGSHVIRALRQDPERGTVRFSFSKYNTAEEIDYAVDTLAKMFVGEKV